VSAGPDEVVPPRASDPDALPRPTDADAPLRAFDPDGVDLAALDRAHLAALHRQRPDELPVVGYGEISLAFAWPPGNPTVVVKSLPPFTDRSRFRAYEAVLEEYLAVLAARGVAVLPTAVRAVADGPTRRAYVLQPRVASERIGPQALAAADHPTGEALLQDVVANVLRACDDHVGIDGQVSNWALVDGRLHYLDVSTPMLRDLAGRDRLDTAPFAASVPWLLRWPVQRFVAPALLAPYHQPRRVLLDTAGNLLRERLAHWLPLLLEHANPHVDPPLTLAEVARFYRANARSWSALQALRRADRAWQRQVRRRPYGFLLPAAYRR
jgi:hypothetical protein